MGGEKTLFDNVALPTTWTDREWGIAAARTRTLFNPSSPIDADKLFSGRFSQIQDTLAVVYERGAHAIIFGERGVGKSSLANTMESRIPPVVKNIKFKKDNCRPEDTFFGLWAKMLWNFQYEGVDISEYLKNETREFIVIKILESLSTLTQWVFIFDEFDRIISQSVKAAMADTIKHFSDYPQNITIIIVGVGTSIDELFGAHPSIQRCCKRNCSPCCL